MLRNSSEREIRLDEADLHLRPGDEDAVETDDEDLHGPDPDADEAEEDEEDVDVPAKFSALVGDSFEDEGTLMKVKEIAFDSELTEWVGYCFSMDDFDERNEDSVTLKDCEYYSCDDIISLIAGVDPAAQQKPKKNKRGGGSSASSKRPKSAPKQAKHKGRKVQLTTGAIESTKTKGVWQDTDLAHKAAQTAKTRLKFAGDSPRFRPSGRCRFVCFVITYFSAT